MMWLLQLLIIWLSIDIVIFATYWYMVNTIKPLCSDWWSQNIALEVDPSLDLEADPRVSEPELEPLHILQL
jgi:hypothetical protein